MNTAEKIRDFFYSNKENLVRVRELAQQVRAMISIIDTFIQLHTSAICPECRKVCCVNKHGHCGCDDLIYMHALGLEPRILEQRADYEPCQFLEPGGCRLDRTVRPSGCNWYFCDALYDSMEKAPGKKYAEFDSSLQELADLWMELGAEFRRQFKKTKGIEFIQ
ncbi:MAG: hypothetical protein WAV13_08975 [Thermodesulfovibrionales bacterium]